MHFSLSTGENAVNTSICSFVISAHSDHLSRLAGDQLKSLSTRRRILFHQSFPITNAIQNAKIDTQEEYIGGASFKHVS